MCILLILYKNDFVDNYLGFCFLLPADRVTIIRIALYYFKERFVIFFSARTTVEKYIASFVHRLLRAIIRVTIIVGQTTIIYNVKTRYEYYFSLLRRTDARPSSGLSRETAEKFPPNGRGKSTKLV